MRILLSPGTDLYVSPETGQLGWMRAKKNLPETYLKYGGQKIGITHPTISFYDNLKLHEIHGLNECLNVYVRNGYWAKGNGYMVFYPSGQLKVLFADGDSCRSTVKVQGRTYPDAWSQNFDENGYVTEFHRPPWLIKPILLRQKTNCSISYFQSYKKSHLDCPY